MERRRSGLSQSRDELSRAVSFWSRYSVTSTTNYGKWEETLLLFGNRCQVKLP